MFRKKPRVTAEISELQERYFTDDVVEGVVVIDIPTDDSSISFDDKLNIKLVGYLNSRFASTVGGVTGAAFTAFSGESLTDSASEKETIISHGLSTTSLNGLVGRHSFPFSVVLPEVLPPSMEVKNEPNEFAIVYGIVADIGRPATLKFNIMTKKKFELRNRCVESGYKPVIAGPVTHDIDGGCCSKGGSVTIGFEADRNVVRLNDHLRLAVAIRNDSKVEIKAMHIELRQHVTWTTQGRSDHLATSVAAIAVPGSQICDLQRAGAKSQVQGQDVASIATTKRADLLKRMDVRSSTEHEIVIPATGTVDVRTDRVNVSHSLCMRLQMGSLYYGPEVQSPLYVQESTDASGQRGTVDATATSNDVTIASDRAASSIQPATVPKTAVRADLRRKIA